MIGSRRREYGGAGPRVGGAGGQVFSLRVKLTLASLGLVILAIASVGLLAVQSIESFFLAHLEDELERDAWILAGRVAPAVVTRDTAELRQYFRELNRRQNVRVHLIDPSGTIIAVTEPEDGAEVGQRLDDPVVGAALRGEAITTSRGRLEANGDLVWVTRPIRLNGEIVGAIRVSYQLQDLSFEIDELRRSLAASFLVVSALAIVLSVLLARQLTAPASRLAAAARRLAAGDREARVGPVPTDEIGAAAAAFDAMAERVHELELERRALMRTVSHDIHSLIAGMRAGVEALDRGAGQDPELGPTLLRGLTSHTARLQRLADDLLESARLESGGLDLNRRPLVPEALLEQARAELAADLADRRIALVVDCEAGLPALDADADRLLQVIGNLVDNSLRYTPPGGQIELSAYRTGPGVGLRLADTGSGFAVEELDGVDGVAGPGGRLGLGLRIARGLVEAHGGRFAIASAPGAGTVVTIELPTEAESTPPPGADDGTPEPRREATEPARAPLAKRQDRRYRRPVRAG